MLTAVEGGAFADAELGRRWAQVSLDARDQALATRLVYGTLAWQGLLDHFIEALGRAPSRLETPVRTLLRLGLFQLTKLSRVPEFAAVDTTVQLSKSFRRGAASGLVNAVLRRYLREKEQMQLPARGGDVPEWLSVTQSHPRWLVEMWLAELGSETTEPLLAANNEPAPTVLRVNLLRSSPEELVRRLASVGVEARPGRFAPQAVVLIDGRDPASLPGHAEGSFTPQGEASQLVAHLLGVSRGQRVLDACAAPGGKTTHISELLGGEGEVVAVDLHRVGLDRIEAQARRLGFDCIRTVRGDARQRSLLGSEPYDAILLDAPCSGLGTLRQHPEIKWRRTPESLRDLSALQRELLTSVAACLRTGGVLVYATCTLSRQENEAVIEEFLASHDDFLRDRAAAALLPDSARDLVDAQGQLRTFPHRGGLDGFFAVRLKRR